MKAELELLGFEISIEEVDGKVTVKVEMNDEIVEELSLDPADYDGESEGNEEAEELKAFGDEDEESEEDEIESEDEDEMMGESIKTFEAMFPSKK